MWTDTPARLFDNSYTHNPRLYGLPPYTVAVVHGGPGAAGEMAPVARELSDEFGVIEPLQTARTIADQVQELGGMLASHGTLPVTVIGYSWGAWLAVLTAVRYPERVKELMLVSSGPFEERYTAEMEKARISRLSSDERREVETLFSSLSRNQHEEREAAFARIGALLSKADMYDPLPDEGDEIECRADIFEGIWREAAELRRSGTLLATTRRVQCPVLAIHGDYDPHPPAGVRAPLNAVLPDFRFVLLAHCGHTPWMERCARDAFFQTVREELRARK